MVRGHRRSQIQVRPQLTDRVMTALFFLPTSSHPSSLLEAGSDSGAGTALGFNVFEIESSSSSKVSKKKPKNSSASSCCAPCRILCESSKTEIIFMRLPAYHPVYFYLSSPRRYSREGTSQYHRNRLHRLLPFLILG